MLSRIVASFSPCRYEAIAFWRFAAHLTPTSNFLIARAASTVIWSSVGCPGRLHLTPRQRAASAAFSVALGRIAADV